MTDKIILSNTSCLIALSKINRLEILSQLFTFIFTTDVVAREFGEPLPEWIYVKEVLQSEVLSDLENVLDKGEASVIALALEIKDCLLLIDEKKGRKIALQLGLSIAGTLQLILLAKQRGIITSAQEVLERLQVNGFRFSVTLRDEILKTAGEL